jgi:two-component system, response regulator PdtaR
MSDRSADTQNPTVLLADDDRLILATLSQGLRKAGFPTVEASSGAVALRCCLDSPPGIAVLDYDIPDMSGLEIARALYPAPFPLIFLSAYGDDQIVRAAADLGVMAFLVKPIDPLHLVPTIHTVMKRFSDLSTLRGESVQLNSALKAARATSIVVGLLMERLRLSEKEAYDRLRAYCRGHNRKVTEVASEILSATERLHETISMIGSSNASRREPS